MMEWTVECTTWARTKVRLGDGETSGSERVATRDPNLKCRPATESMLQSYLDTNGSLFLFCS